MRRKSIPLTLAALALSTSAMAAEVNIKFTADIVQPTCDIKLEGTGTSATGTNAYKLVIPDIRLDQLRAKSSETEGKFKLTTNNTCSGNPSKITTKINGNKTGYPMNLVVPDVNGNGSNGLTSNVGVGFRRAATTTDSFFGVKNDQDIEWTSTEITNGLELAAVMRETQVDAGSVGNFSAKVTFSFTYE